MQKNCNLNRALVVLKIHTFDKILGFGTIKKKPASVSKTIIIFVEYSP